MSDKRLEYIRKCIISQGYLNLAELSRQLNVSESTVRRDLQILEKEGVLTRNHGGAVINPNFKQLSERSSSLVAPIQIDNIEEKTAIAEEAAKLVSDGDFIAIGSGTSCLVFARSLFEKKDLKIITNNLFVAMELSGHSNIQVIMSGGVALFRNNCVNTLEIGGDAFGFGNIRASKIFCSVLGIDFTMGYSDLDFEYLNSWKRMMQHAETSILLTTHEKFGKRGYVTIAGLDVINQVVSSSLIPEEYLSFYRKNNIAVHLAPF